MIAALLELPIAYGCPFCQGRFGVTLEPPGVAHTAPPCEAFGKLEPDQYLYAVNEALGHHTGADRQPGGHG